VTPGSATVAVGGTAQYSVVARDGTGLVITTPPVTWASGTAAVGSISAAGLAAGVAPGQTAITVTAGSVVSPAAVLNVVDTSVCDGIAAVPNWAVNLEYLYADDIRTPAGADVRTTQRVTVTATLSLLGPAFQNKIDWVGSLAPGLDHLGVMPRVAVHIVEHFSDLVSDPNTVADVFYDAGGLPAPTPGVDGFRLEVDLATCTFQFFAAPTTHTTIQKTETAVNTLPGPDNGKLLEFKQFTELGLLQKAVTPLGAWRTLGMGDYPTIITGFDAYPVGITVPSNVDAYTPSGLFPQAAFFDPLHPAIRINKADMYYRIVPQF
jgi:hypothetical protein